MSSFWQWCWLVGGVLVFIVVIIDAVVDFWKWPETRSFRDKQRWWWKKFRRLAYLLAIAIAAVSWLVNLPARRLADGSSKSQEKKGVLS